jgi:hypothetical protein
MQNSILKELKIKLPDDIVNAVSSSEIVSMLLDKALTKVEYYKSKCKEFEGKYNMDFSSFKKKVETAGEEEFAEWDDLIIWEGYELASHEWMKKYEALKSCMA